MANLNELIQKMGGTDGRFGVLAESNTTQLTVIARNLDVAVGDLFLLPSERGPQRIYMFRTTQYANVMNRLMDMNDVARNKLTMKDSYFSANLADELLLELKGIVLGYAEYDEVGGSWSFHRPRRLPQHLTDVYQVQPMNPATGDVVRELMASQLGEDGLYVGDLLAGESSLGNVPVNLPPFALSHHIGVFGRTGSGKSNTLMVLLRSIMDYNRRVENGLVQDRKCSILAIDPHDEFRNWHKRSGGKDGIEGIVGGYSPEERQALVDPFFYLTAKNIEGDGLARSVKLSRGDVTPDDLISLIEFSEQQALLTQEAFAQEGDGWVEWMLTNDSATIEAALPSSFLPGTISAVQRRLSPLRAGQNRIFTPYGATNPTYRSNLADIVCALEQGRVLVVDTTLMTEMEQFLLSTIVSRTLFALRRALKSSSSASTLERDICSALYSTDAGNPGGNPGLASLAEDLLGRLRLGELPYLDGGRRRDVSELPYVNVVIEEAPSVLNPERMKFGSVFRDISRQGRKFGIGLTVVSQQITEIDQGVLTQINTELTMALGNDMERREAIKNASADLAGFERELQVMGKGQFLVSASYRDVPLPTQAPNYDEMA
jgi:hypothetical protein